MAIQAVHETSQLAAVSVSKPGDANQDGSLDIFDLISLLMQMRGSAPLSAPADFDSNGKITISDLLAWLRQVAGLREKPTEDFQVVPTINLHVLSGPTLATRKSWDANGELRADYHIYSNRELEEVVFVLGRDTLTQVQGRTPVLSKVDPDTIDPLSNFYTEPFAWSVRVKDDSGNWWADSGRTRFSIIPRGVLADYGCPIVGLQVNFPLVLRGPWQRFKVSVFPYLEVSYIIDLNPSGADSVVFSDPDSLAETAMQSVFQNNPVDDIRYFSNPFYISPAVADSSGKKVDRLIFSIFTIGVVPVIEAEDGNGEILRQLGLPAWLRKLPSCLVDYNFDLDHDYLDKYRYPPFK